MVIKVDRAFANVGFSAGGAVFAPRPLPSGELEATQATGGAVIRRFAATARALDVETQAIVQQGQAIRQTGEDIRLSGRDINATFRALEQRRQGELNRHQAATAKLNAFRGFSGAVTSAMEASDASGAGALQAFEARSREITDESLARITDDVFRQTVADDLALAQARAEIEVRKAVAKKEGAFLRAELDKQTATYTDLASRTRGGEQTGIMLDGLANIQDAMAGGTISPVEGERQKAAFRSQVLDGTIKADVAASAPAAQARLDAGSYDHLFANDFDRASAQATITRGIKTQQSVAVANVKSRMPNDLASIEATGKGIPGFRNEVAAVASKDFLAQYDQLVSQARAVNTAIVNTKYLPFAETAAGIRAPEAGSENFVFQQRLFDAQRKALATNIKAFQNDPYTYAASNPSVRNREDVISLQKVIGGEDIDFRFYSKPEASQLVEAYDQADSANKIDQISQIVAQAGENGGKAMEDLLEAKLPVSANVLRLHAFDDAIKPLLVKVLEAEKVGRAELKKGFATTDITELNESVRATMVDFRFSSTNGNAAGVTFANQVEDTVKLLALSYMNEGVDAATAGTRAADDLFNNFFNYNGYRVPVRFNSVAVEALSDQRLQEALTGLPRQGVIGRSSDGRVIVANPDGSFSTERSITVTDPLINNGQPTNIPSMFGGQQRSQSEAIRIIAENNGVDPETGRQLPSFASIEDAVRAAGQRSDEKGRLDPLAGLDIGDSGEAAQIGRALESGEIDLEQASRLTETAERQAVISREILQESIKQNAFWVNSADGEGLVLWSGEGAPVFSNGRPVTLRFDEVSQSGPSTFKTREGSTQDIGARDISGTTARELFEARRARRAQ